MVKWWEVVWIKDMCTTRAAQDGDETGDKK
jgi:hypothetical protein